MTAIDHAAMEPRQGVLPGFGRAIYDRRKANVARFQDFMSRLDGYSVVNEAFCYVACVGTIERAKAMVLDFANAAWLQSETVEEATAKALLLAIDFHEEVNPRYDGRHDRQSVYLDFPGVLSDA